ncbi:hypothetical protein TWF569_009658 [Orbilia oligospora]|uniref:Uncharacterized protein n=1 Tax=Orbilia oligospora TaxID=2813651 RepID=A0A7C8JA42_ORBOL|nr:hypothetical protein TWF102_006713 [Orbilia oligospora]KAF3101437.1 hypothetical protein TWF103_008003 [Orbilia oligospora]KAF3101438.1 hypothetical protein TWF103_008003 [Orbilia oligospora]KAF3130246.1 hypothetical protein TWF594_010482 [Orbilia oligospora]KAF3135724.1 hypothetical protein TWF569_009658 [Orbilia oligospora]
MRVSFKLHTKKETIKEEKKRQETRTSMDFRDQLHSSALSLNPPHCLVLIDSPLLTLHHHPQKKKKNPKAGCKRLNETCTGGCEKSWGTLPDQPIEKPCRIAGEEAHLDKLVR